MGDDARQIKRVEPPYPFEAYSHIISPVPDGNRRGFLLTIPDLPGCMSDGKTIDEAIENGRDAFYAAVSAMADTGREIPAPLFRPQDTTLPTASGKFVARVPKSLHAQLTARAKQEGVSLNSLVLSFLASGVARGSASHRQ